VTGGSRGLGLGIASKLICEGYRVIAIARKVTPELTSAIREAEAVNPGSFQFLPFDLAQIDEISNLVETVRKSFGPIYGLVNNAAVSFEGALSLMHNHRIEQLVRLNTLSPMILTKYVVRSMMIDGAGRIVNVASIIGSTGYKGLTVYGATKASMLGFTRSLAREVGPMGVNVNSVAPGFVVTDMTQELKEDQRQQIIRRSALGRLAQIEDVANAVEFLLSDKAKNITGTVITVDAGNTA
jgi:3-oxoacyl-[acyl-carrier protein] reductase